MTLTQHPADEREHHDVPEALTGEREHDVTQRLATAALVVIVALGAAEQVRYRWGRVHRTANRWWADVEHRGRDDLLRKELRTMAGLLVPVIGSRVGHRQP